MAENSEERKVRIVVDAMQANASIKEMAAGAAIMKSQLDKMSQDDPRRAQLQDDFARLTARIKETSTELRTVKKSAEELAAEEQKLAEQTAAVAAQQAAAVESGKRQTASMREMKDAAGILGKQLEEMSAEDPGRAALLRDYQVLQQRINAAGTEMRTYQKTAEELAEEERKLAEETERLNRENQQVILNGQKVNASFKEMKDSAALLEKQLHDLAADDPNRAKLLKDYQELSNRIDGVKKEMGETAEKGLTMKDALAFAGVSVGLEAAVEVVKELGAEIIQSVQEFEKLRSSINGLTGATGAELDQLTTGVAGLAKTFGKEYDEVLVASNALAKQMGISQQEALSLLEKGFIAGADINGEFLDQVKEYPAQFKDAGVSASEFIGILSKSQTDGVFSDKGVDVVKEFGLRIREQTKATKDALYAAFGPEFTKEILDGVNNGSMSSVQALERISKQMNDTQIPAAQLQTVIADVFGGPGEDAGLEYLQSLHKVGGGIDSLIDKNNAYTQRQQALLDSNKALAATQNDLAKEFEGTGTTMETLGNNGMAFIYTLLTSLVVTFKELFEPVQAIWNSFVELGASLNLFLKEGEGTVSIGQAIGAVFRFLLSPLREMLGALAESAKQFVEWAKSSEVARAALEFMTLPIRTLYQLLSDGPAYFAAFSAEAESRFNSIGRAWRRLLDRDFSGAADEFRNMGKNAGEAYDKAFAAATAKKASASATTSAGGAQPEPPKKPGGGDGMTEDDKAKAEKDAETARNKALAAQNKADQARLNATKQWVKEEGDQLLYRNSLRTGLEDRMISDEEARRDRQREKLFADATAQVDKLTGLESDYSEQVAVIVENRDLALRELTAKFAEEDEQRRQRAIEERIAQNEADREVALAELEVKLANGVLDEQTYQDAIYAVKQAAAERELALIREQKGSESVEYKKATADKMAADADYIAKKKKADDEMAKFEKAVAAVKKIVTSEEVAYLGEALGKKNVIYKAAQAIQKAIAITEIQIGLQKQIAANTEAGAKISAMAPPVSVPLGTAYTIGTNILSGIGAASGIAKILGFRSGGNTSGGGSMLDMAKLEVASNGKLLDEEGFAVAGIVHENEYVIPEWMRVDPKVMQVEGWLEQRRQRGFIEGGPTSEGSSPAPVGDVLDSGESVGLLQQLLAEQRRQNERMDTWARELKVVQQLYDFDKQYETYKKVNQDSGFR